MRVLIEIRKTVGIDLSDIEETITSDIEKVKKCLAYDLRWESIDEKDFLPLLNEMATQLPDDDLDSFVTYVKGGMTSKTPRAYLTIGGFLKDGLLRIRIRILARNNAVLPQLGKILADALLKTMTDYDLSKMVLWEKRQPEALMSGHPQDVVPVTLFVAVRSSPHMAIPLLVALAVLLGGGIWAHFDSGRQIWNDSLWIWYGRLFGPCLMAVITTFSAIAFQIGRGGPVRTAEWDIATNPSRSAKNH